MKLRDVASTSFVLIRADAAAAAAGRLIAASTATHVIVEGRQAGEWYLVPIGSAKQRLADAGRGATVEDALGLARLSITPVIERGPGRPRIRPSTRSWRTTARSRAL